MVGASGVVTVGASRRDFVLDSTVIRPLADDQMRLSRLCDAVIARGCRLVVPYVVVAEACGGPEHHAATRLDAIWTIIEVMWRRRAGAVGYDIRQLIEAERNGATLSAVPTLDRGQTEALAKLVAGPDGRAWATEMLNTAYTSGLDAGAATALAEWMRQTGKKVSSKSLGEHMQPFAERALHPESWALDQVARSSARWTKRVRTNPHRYPIAACAACYYHLHFMSALFVRYGYDRWGPKTQTPVLRKPDKNDWVDMRIACSGALAAAVVTGDNVLMARVRFIGDQLAMPFAAMTLNELEATLSANPAKP